MRNRIILVATVTICTALYAANAEAQTRHSIWDGVYTDAQATRGAAQYRQHCAICHSANLSGSYETPPLMGRFVPYWSGTTLDVLLDYMNTAMPLERPGSVDRSTDADILAFILRENNVPSGSTELKAGADDLKVISFDTEKPPAAGPVKKLKSR
jgi:S-disulfanyl-L-cysteine oxidoreductase SoxD